MNNEVKEVRIKRRSRHPQAQLEVLFEERERLIARLDEINKVLFAVDIKPASKQGRTPIP